MKFTSQFGQDVHALFTIFKGKRNGYFVEVGAYDGLDSSNCYTMERYFGWKGVAVECSPSKFALLQKNRSCICVPNAVYSENDKDMEFFDSGGYAGLVQTNNHAHIVNDTKIVVKTKTLTRILEEANAPPYIDYLSLDTEGSEFEILRSHDFSRYRFGYICVEHNSIERNRSRIRAFLESKGYTFVKVNGSAQWGEVDDEYIHESLLAQPQKQMILFVNSCVQQCGVYQYGKRVFDYLTQTSGNYNYVYVEFGSAEEQNQVVQTMNVSNAVAAIVYNFHHFTLPWLNANTIVSNIPSIGIIHEYTPSSFFTHTVSTDSEKPKGLPRPLLTFDSAAQISPEFEAFLSIQEEGVPVFGTFGFGFLNKGYDKIVKLVCEQYEKAIVKLLIPSAHFHRTAKEDQETIRRVCKPQGQIRM